MVPFIKGLNYYEKLFIVDFIIYFRWCKLLEIKSDAVEFSIKAFLGKNYPSGVIGGINFDYHFLKGVK